MTIVISASSVGKLFDHKANLPDAMNSPAHEAYPCTQASLNAEKGFLIEAASRGGLIIIQEITTALSGCWKRRLSQIGSR